MNNKGSIGNKKTGECPICLTTCDKSPFFTHDEAGQLDRPKELIECPRCGTYWAGRIFDHRAPDPNGVLGPANGRIRADLSAFILERQSPNNHPINISDDFLSLDKHDPLGDVFRALPPLNFFQRADKLLKALSEEQPAAGRDIELVADNEKWQAKAWALDREEWEALLNYLYQSNRLDDHVKGQYDFTRIAPKGWERLEQIEKEGPSLEQGFVAMWFDEKLDSLYEKVIYQAVRCAGYVPLRIDKQPGEERIDHRIEVELKKSRFVVADLTGHRGGVYFEAGFARALGRPVFFTCHKDDFDNLHFDTRQFNCLNWDSSTFDKLKNDLRYSIENVCGRGPVPVKIEEC